MEEDHSVSNSFNWKEFSQRTWVVVVSGLVFPPLGIFLSWRKTDWAPKAKWIATGLLSLLLLWRMGGSEKKERPDPATVAEATAAAKQDDDNAGGTYSPKRDATRKYNRVCEALNNGGFKRHWECSVDEARIISGFRGFPVPGEGWPPPNAGSSIQECVLLAASVWLKQTTNQDGEEDAVVIVGEAVPLRKQARMHNTPDATYTTTEAQVMLHGLALKTLEIYSASKLGPELLWLQLPNTKREYKTRANSTIVYKAIWIVGTEVAETDLVERSENRAFPSPDGMLRYGDMTVPCVMNWRGREPFRRSEISKVVKFRTGGAVEP